MTTSHETRVKLSQWDSLLLESLRSQGWTNEALIDRLAAAGEDELPKDESDFQFDYEALAAFARQEPETFRKAVRDGYQIKYNTIRGIRSWILVAFGQEPELVLDEGNESVTARLTASEHDRLASVLSFGWTIIALGEPPEGAAANANEPLAYRIEPLKS